MKTTAKHNSFCSLFVGLCLCWQLERACAQSPGPGSALSLDGASGYAQAPNGVWFSNDFTIEGWVFVRNYNSSSRLLDFADGPNTNNVYLALSGNTNGFPVLGVFTNNNSSPTLQATNQLPLNQWVHLAATLKGTTGTIYINGNLAGSGTLNQPPNVIRTNNYIGRSNYATDGYADALFDEIRIWSLARTQGQIQASMHRSLVGNETGLVSYWRMDEDSGTTLTDSTGNGQNATLFGGTSRSNSFAPIVAGPGFALNFDAALTQSATISNQAALDAYPLTIMTWFKSPTTNMNGALVNKYVSSSLNGYQLFMSGGHLQGWYFRPFGANVYNGGPMDAGPVNDGLWHHAAMVIDAAGGRLYVDGVLRSNLAWTETAGPTTTAIPLSLGYYPGDSSWSGQLDEVSIWNTNLSTAQIQSAMNRPLTGSEPGLLGYWRMDEGGGTNIVDSSTNRNNGTLNNNPAWVASGARLVLPDPGYGLSLNGTNAYVRVANGVWFSNTFTIEGWVYMRSYNSWSRLLDFGNGPSVQDVFLVLSDGVSGFPTVGIFNSGTAPQVVSTNQLPLNQWAHLAGTFDGTNGAIYINGNLSGMGPISGPPVNVIRTNNYFGRSAFSGDGYANALFDEIRIWNVAHTQLQVQRYMNWPLTGSEPGLVGYWRFDDGAGTNCVDGTGNGNNATLVNGPAWIVSSAGVSFAPALFTLPATNINGNPPASATLQALVNPNGFPTTVWFAWGTNQTYGVTNVFPNIGSGTDLVLVTNNISGLVVGAAYHFQVSASNSVGLMVGPDQTFSLALPPQAITLDATGVTPTNATLHATITPNGEDTTVYFQYGSVVYRNIITTPSFVVSGTNGGPVSVSNVVNVVPGLLYQYEVIAGSVFGTNIGNDVQFSVPPTLPELEDQSVIGTKIFNTFVYPNGADTEVWFQYGPTTNYGFSSSEITASSNDLSGVTIQIPTTNLAIGMLYHFQAVASNVVGTTYGPDQSFTTPHFTYIDTAIPSFANGSCAWGDYDGDGLMDVLITGDAPGNPQITELWQNTDGGFTNISTGLPGVDYSSVAWGDSENDGQLDILISGVYSVLYPITQVWLNTGSGFINGYAGPISQVQNSSVAWGDHDNDGQPDILLSGQDGNGGLHTEIWRNIGNGNGFTNIAAGLTPLFNSSVAWGDYDNDGRLDILLSGNDGSISHTEVWRNTGSGFTNINAGLTGVSVGSVAWGDYDNDGRLDILLSGLDSSNNPVTEVWRNTGNGFTNINAGLPGVEYGSVAWGDYDNDGRPDILLSGIDANGDAILQVWRNTTNGFVNVLDEPGVAYAATAAWVDVNNDGQLDVFVAGGPTSAQAQIWLNENGVTNTRPMAPSGLSASLSGSSLTLSWNAGSDLETPVAGLSYNLRVGSAPGGSDILSPMALADGTRLVPQRGNIQGLQYTFQLPSPPALGTTYYWSVQTIDTAFAGSPFAPEAVFTVQPLFTSWNWLGNGAFQVGFNVANGTSYTVQASTNLINWVNLLNFTSTSNGNFLFTDLAATNYSRRFYRFGQH